MPFLGKLFLNENISKVDIFSLVVGFFGIILMAKSEQNHNDYPNEFLGVMLSLVGGI